MARHTRTTMVIRVFITGYQFSYRVFAIASDGCNGNTSNFVDNCNESNILHVVSLPDAASGTPISQCNNSDLDDCGYWDDTTPPVLTVPSNQTFTATNSTGITFSSVTDVSWLSSVTAIDSVINSTGQYSQQLFPVCVPSNDLTPNHWSLAIIFFSSLSLTFPTGTTTISCTATDYSGNTTSDSFTVTVNYTPPPPAADTTPPVVTVPQNIVCDHAYCQATNSTGFNVSFAVVVNDAGDGWTNNSSQVSCSPASNSLFPIGTTTVTCTATDSAGNVGTGTFTVTVSLEDAGDTTPPVLNADLNDDLMIAGVATVRCLVAPQKILPGIPTMPYCNRLPTLLACNVQLCCCRK